MNQTDRGPKSQFPEALPLKEKLRLQLIPPAAKLTHSLGKDWTWISEKLGRETMIAQVSSWDLPDALEQPEKQLDVMFFTLMGGNNRIASVEMTMMRALLARGHHVRMILCDQALPICEVKSARVHDRWEELCAKCYAFGRELFTQAGFEVIPLSKLIAQQYDENEEWPVHVQSALLKHFRIGRLEENQLVTERREMFKNTARISAAAARAVIEMGVDRVVMSHGNYCTWGPARDVFNDAGVPVLVYADTMKRNSIRMHWKHDSYWHEIADEFSRQKEIPLTAEQDEKLDRYLESRRTHKNDDRVYNLGSEEDAAATYARFDLDPEKPVFCMFTNLMWDGSSVQREIAFADTIDWVKQTIDWFALNPDKQLLIKVHPAEYVVGTDQSVATIVKESYPELPVNVRLIEPDAKVNSWSIIKILSGGIIHSSTICLELCLEAVQTIVVSETQYRGHGFTLDVSSPDEYFGLLENWSDSLIDRDRVQALARRFAYIFFERYQMPFPFIHTIKANDIRALTNANVKTMLDHQTIRTFIGSLESQQDFLLPA